LPKGVSFNKGTISGTPSETGTFRYILSLGNGKSEIEKEFDLIVRGKNIAPQASKIVANIDRLNMHVLDSCWYTFGLPQYAETVNVINDGKLNGEGSVFYTLAAASNLPKIDYLGYEWDVPKQISAIGLHVGCMEEFGGWFSHLNIQYMNEKGIWIPIPEYKSIPELPDTDISFFQPHFVEYLLQFSTVTTKSIRVLFDSTVQNHWQK
jgi:hypothetical protein